MVEIVPTPAHSVELSKKVLESKDIVKAFEYELRGVKEVKENGMVKLYQIEGFKQKLTEEGILFVVGSLKAFLNRNRFLSSYKNEFEAREDVRALANAIAVELEVNPDKFLYNKEDLESVMNDVCDKFIQYAKAAAYRPVGESDKKFLQTTVQERHESFSQDEQKERRGGFLGFFR